MAHVHNFTMVGLEAQATAFSYERDGIIQYLVLIPQINEVSNISNRECGVTEFDAFEHL